VRGIDQEIAVLRLRLRRLLSEHPEDFALAVRSIELLVRAVGAAGKLTTDDSNEVLDRIYAELGGIVALIAEAGAGPELSRRYLCLVNERGACVGAKSLVRRSR